RESYLSTAMPNSSLFYLRFVFFLFYLVWIALVLFRNRFEYFLYLTNWNWIIGLFYFLNGFLTCARVSLSTKQTLININWVLFPTLMPFALIVTIGYWTIGKNPNDNPYERFIATIQHTINIIFPTIDLLLCTTVLRPTQIIYPIIAMSTYTAMTLIGHLVYKIPWPYSFLDNLLGVGHHVKWDRIVVLVLILLLNTAVSYILMYNVVFLRDKIRVKECDDVDEENDRIDVQSTMKGYFNV
ncbi:hypothetical protein BC833DRAFT_591884, partial [Globomyces pollinis-pini]